MEVRALEPWHLGISEREAVNAGVPRNRGLGVMEHLLLEVAATPLRLIAAKNEKSRSELGRFLAKQVRKGGRGKAWGRPWSSLGALWRLVTLAGSLWLHGGRGVRTCLRRLRGASPHSWGSLPFLSLARRLLCSAQAVWQGCRSERYVVEC